jgi:hypothetical protein
VTAEIDESGDRYVNYEPDVSRKLRGPAVMVDEDEFREACYEAPREAVRLADGWLGRGLRSWRPVTGGPNLSNDGDRY